ncbi:MAG: hypothetical protein IKT62_01745 [Firmicutes bacterium]|nr:hypothetical protein [Bacillota bacterium]
MKRLITLFMIFILALSFTACGDSGSDEGTKDSSDLAFSEVTAADNDEYSIKITGIEPDNEYGFTLKALFENKSSDKTYMYSVYSASINGVKCDPFFATTVAAGKKAKEEISFMTDDLEANGLTEFTEIELTFDVYDEDDWEAAGTAIETVVIYPYGEEKASTYVREPQSSDVVLIDNEYATLISTGFEQDELWGYTANLFLVNKTEKNLMFSADDVSVNGYMLDPLYAELVPAGKCAFGFMSWFTDEFEDNDITNVEEIEFLLSI